MDNHVDMLGTKITHQGFPRLPLYGANSNRHFPVYC